MKNVAECSECGKALCPRINEGCKLHFMGVCDGCHPEKHEDGFREIWWIRLETALISPSFETDPKRKYHTYCGMYNWVRKYDSENSEKLWELLEKQFDAGIPISFRSQSFTIQEMIRWVQKFDSSNHNREWDLLERWRNYSEQDEDSKQLQKVLLRMSRWVEEHDPENSEKLWELLTIRYTSGGLPFLLKLMGDLLAEKFPQDRDKVIQLFDLQMKKDVSERDLKGQSIALQNSINFLGKNAPDEIGKIWELYEMKISVDEQQNNLMGQSITLKDMYFWLQENAPEEPERAWGILEKRHSVEERQNIPIGQSIVLSHKISWLEANSPEDSLRWDLLEKKHEIDTQIGDSKSLGMNLQRMINWAEINDPEDPHRVWDLLERKLEIEYESEDIKSQGMTLQRMSNWINENDPDALQRKWDILVKILSNSSDQGAQQSISMTLQRMVNWLKEHDPENVEMIWDLVEEKIVNEFENGGNKGISMMLREMSRLLQEFDIKGKRKTRFDEFHHEFLKRIENVGDILELSVSLWNTGESLPSEIYDRFDDNDNLDKFVERWCRTFAPLPLEGWILSPDYSNIIPNIEIYISEEMTNISQLRITNSTSGIKPSEIQDWAVLDLPNILGWGERYSSLDSNALDEILNEAELLFERTYVYLTPTTLSKYEEIVRSLIERDNVEILIGNSDRIEINEDWIFLSFAMIHGCHIVSRDNFTQEIESTPNIEEFLEKSKLSFRWWNSGSFSIDKIRNLDYLSEENSELSDDEISLTNLCMKIVYDYYGPEFYSQNIHHISFDFDSGTLEIHPRRKESIGRIIGRRGRQLGGLGDLFRDKFESRIPIKVVLPTD